MSGTWIKYKDQLRIWLFAGGRCEYPGCNEPLWKDNLTLAQLNRAYLAHIIAEKPDGPRGDPVLSEKLKADPTNIILLCDTHHRLVDKKDVEGHPVELLRKFKQEHEERIERQTAIQANRRTHIVLFGTRIADRQGLVNYEQAYQAILPERYPANEKGIRMDLACIKINEEDPEFWDVVRKHVKRGLYPYLNEGIGPGGKPLNHLSVFAIAPIPALIILGKELGDILTIDVYQRHRNTNDWQWRELENEAFDYITSSPDDGVNSELRVALNLSLSGVVHTTEIENTVGEKIPIYKLTIAQPNRDFLQAKEQLELFRFEWYKLLSKIREVHGKNCEIHLFPAVPNSVAVEIGRSLLPKSDPCLVIYDYNKTKGGFIRTIVV